MADDEDNDGRSPSATSASNVEDNDEDVAANGLVATRKKRATAGNLYATLRQNLDDEELQRELMADEEDDEGEYEGSDKDDDDAAMEESSDDEDAGPAKEGEKEDLAGEKELQRAERAAAKKKRKFDEARMRLPGWQKQKKRVRLADGIETAPKPKKKSERSNWLPTAADQPSRQSTRASAVANREHVHENLKASTKRSENQKKIMRVHQERQKKHRMRELTQEERMLKAARVEKETMRDFGRWEREEAEKQRIREELAAAKRRKVIEGPVIRHWSGSVLWEGDSIKIKRMPQQEVMEVADAEIDGATKGGDTTEVKSGIQNAESSTTAPTVNGDASATPAAAPAHTDVALPPSHPQPQAPWLAGIHDYASPEPTPDSQLLADAVPYVPSAPLINGAPTVSHLHPAPSTAQHPQTTQPTPFEALAPVPTLQTHQGWSPAQQHTPGPYQQFQIQPQNPLPPPQPLLREQAQRSLIILDQFEALENIPTSTRRSKTTARDNVSSTEPTPLASVLIPDCYPTLSQEEDRYLISHKLRKKAGSKTGELVFIFPAAPEKERCALTSWPAKYRDPNTGLPYADLSTGRMLRRLLGGGCLWSGFLGAWVGPSYGAVGRAARGVPDGFGAPLKDVKMEGTS